MKIAVIGRGNVGTALGEGWRKVGHVVHYGVRTPAAIDQGTVADVVPDAEVVVLTVPFSSVDSILATPDLYREKVVLDCTNPIAADFSGLDSRIKPSGAEWIAAQIPRARVVKIFNSVGVEVMANTNFGTELPSMLYAGSDSTAKSIAHRLAADLGFEPIDAGPLEQSRSLESLAWLWISMAVKYGHGRDMAFRLIKR